jgi:hypothetical protein
MKSLLFAFPLVLSLGGCMAVLGYEPTPAELEAIKRGEDPRAGEGSRNTAGQAGEPEEPGQSDPETTRRPGPSEGTVLRWLDYATLVIEADGNREVVHLADEVPPESVPDENALLDERMNRWTYGSFVRLTYPLSDPEGATIYRDADGRLLARLD